MLGHSHEGASSFFVRSGFSSSSHSSLWGRPSVGYELGRQPQPENEQLSWLISAAPLLEKKGYVERG